MRWITLSAVLFCTPGLLRAQEATGEIAVVEVVRAFHAALAAGDSVAVVRWFHPEVLIFESGHAETLDEYRAGHLPSDLAFALATDRELITESVIVWGDEALYTSETRTSGRWRDRDINVHGVETLVLMHSSDGWRIRHIHWSSR